MARVQNSVTLIGYITREIEMRKVGDSTVANFTVAVNRIKGKDGAQNTDFIPCQAWGKQGEFVGKYFKKGQKVAVYGEIRVNSYTTKDDEKRSYTVVNVDSVDFCDGKAPEKSASDSAAAKPKSTRKAAAPAVVDDDDMPWA